VAASTRVKSRWGPGLLGLAQRRGTPGQNANRYPSKRAPWRFGCANPAQYFGEFNEIELPQGRLGAALVLTNFPYYLEPMALRRSQWALIIIAVLALAAAGAYRLAGAEQKPVADILPPKTSAPVTPAASVVPAAPVAPADRPSKLVTGLRPIRIPPAPQVNPAPP
jgi:hypothetical protein